MEVTPELMDWRVPEGFNSTAECERVDRLSVQFYDTDEPSQIAYLRDPFSARQ